MVQEMASCFGLLRQAADCALILALDNAGNNIAARIAMIAMTTSNSINVNARLLRGMKICIRCSSSSYQTTKRFFRPKRPNQSDPRHDGCAFAVVGLHAGILTPHLAVILRFSSAKNFEHTA